METIGDRLKNLRKENKLTQKDMAEKLGIHPNTISMYEKGNRNIPSTMIKKISDTFNVSTDYLLRGEEKKGKQEFSSLDETLLNDENYLNLTLKNMLKDSQMVAFQDYKSWSVEDKKELLLILLNKK
ncbi:helix-turn-helix domain-containing protein [Anaerofustis sp. NSJ-163]|uniref:helix-turn-helix domain-containing protein n=1 Tax=Anaerofustis sp. NSJ-163 TaxID=2944391 RepID=UPI00209C3122|nr:helix-turn-helix transcriptional regulator [Anaerofustis sp. NSJ-163]MCO8193738.1 helix-turn-helix domain-containing protein [Anaerofustis sp. NSJ-163]